MSEILKSDDQDARLARYPSVEIKAMPWLIWVVGAAGCAALILVVTHLTEEKEFLHLTERIEPCWLGLALLLQSTTYVTQGMVWCLVSQAMGHPLKLGKAFELGMAMLFVDQALPSAGASGVAMVSGALSRTGMPRAVVASTVLVDVAMYYLAYAFCMAVVLGVTLTCGYLPGWADLVMLLFAFTALGVTWFLTNLPGGGMSGLRA